MDTSITTNPAYTISDGRMTLVIPADADGLTIKAFFSGRLHFSMHQIRRIKYRPEGILVNGEPRWVNHVLQAGDTLSFSLESPPQPQANDLTHTTVPQNLTHTTVPQNLPADMPSIPILYEDDMLLIVDKPSGLVCHPSHGHYGDSILDLLQMRPAAADSRISAAIDSTAVDSIAAGTADASAGRRLYLMGRLDKDTSGVLVFAKNQEAASLLTKQRDAGLFHKEYLALVRGCDLPESGVVNQPIGIATEKPLRMQIDPEHGKPAETQWQQLGPNAPEESLYSDPVSLLRVTLLHGRTHQIRVHMASVGHPLVGDPLYGNAAQDATLPEEELFAHLHAARVCLLHPFTKKRIDVTANAPKWCQFMIDSKAPNRIE